MKRNFLFPKLTITEIEDVMVTKTSDIEGSEEVVEGDARRRNPIWSDDEN